MEEQLVVKICDLDAGTAYFCSSPEECHGEVDRSVLELCKDECICFGKTVGYPEHNFSTKDYKEFDKFGLNRIFKI